LDTRTKIIDIDRAAQLAGPVKLVAGYFDVLTPDHAVRLGELKDGAILVAMVLDPPSPLLSSNARAELAAALSAVDYVVPINGASLEAAVERIRPAQVVREEDADLRRARNLIEHVLRRQQA
jgi:bifunctional ADP-heptose synthase (sugar kinase/adenylyltransferase)